MGNPATLAHTGAARACRSSDGGSFAAGMQEDTATGGTSPRTAAAAAAAAAEAPPVVEQDDGGRGRRRRTAHNYAHMADGSAATALALAQPSADVESKELARRKEAESREEWDRMARDGPAPGAVCVMCHAQEDIQRSCASPSRLLCTYQARWDCCIRIALGLLHQDALGLLQKDTLGLLH